MDNFNNHKEERLYYIDNLRIYLTILVILHHIAIGYGGHGTWALYEGDFHTIDNVVVIILTLFTAINQSYFMSMFFFIAGYFTPHSYDKKGSSKFLKDRFVRLGIPILIYTIFISSLVEFILVTFVYEQNITYLELVESHMKNLMEGIDHLWFLLALLIFVGAYSLYRIIKNRYLANQIITPFLDEFPTNKIIIIMIGILSIVTYFIRLFYAVGDTIIFNFQLAHFGHYLFSFLVGLLAYRGRWLYKLRQKQAKPWILSTILIIPPTLIGLLLLVDFTNSDPFGPFLGGLTYQSLFYVIWESLALLSISITLFYVFKKRFNSQSILTKELGLSTYTAYIIHVLIIITIMIIFLPLNFHPFIKFVLVSMIGIPTIFVFAFLIRKIPYTEKVLG